MAIRITAYCLGIVSVAWVVICVSGRLFGVPMNVGPWLPCGLFFAFITILLATRVNTPIMTSPLGLKALHATIVLIVIVYSIAFFTMLVSSKHFANIPSKEVIFKSREAYLMKGTGGEPLPVSALRYHIFGVSEAIMWAAGPFLGVAYALIRVITGRFW